MMEEVRSLASGIDKLLCLGSYWKTEVRSWIMVTGSEIQLNEADELADKQDGEPMRRISFSMGKVLTSFAREGAGWRDVTGGRVISADFVDRRSVCGDEALTTKGTRGWEDYGGRSQHSNSKKHQNAFSILFIDRVLISASRHDVSVYRNEAGWTYDHVLFLIFTAQYMSREPVAKVGFDSCDHTVLSTARHHDHAVFLFFMAQYVGRELVFAFNIDYSDCAGTADCKVLFQAATAQCVALRLAFDSDCIDCVVDRKSVV